MKKILVDMTKLRDLSSCQSEAFDPQLLEGKTFKTIRELASFHFTCRRCQDSPCITVCPTDALEKNGSGIINRALNLCIRCKSCITACPFGTLMSDLFAVKTQGYHHLDLSDEKELEKFAKNYKNDVVTLFEGDAKQDEHVYQLSEKVLIRDIMTFEQ